MKYIEIIGEICLDIIMHNPNSVMVHGEKLWSENIILTPGGSAVYTSAALSHLGEYVRICGSLGNDDEGEKILRMLREINVDYGDVTILKGARTTISMLICDGAQKTFLGCSPMLPLIIPSIESLNETKLIYIAGYMLYEEFWTDKSFEYFKRAHELGIPIVIDIQGTLNDSFNSNPNDFAQLYRILPFCSVFFAAEKEFCYLKCSQDRSTEAAQLLKTGLRTAVLKRGNQGAIAFDKDGACHSGGYAVDAYDAIGSGDIFGAAYTYCLMNCLSTRQCVEFANVFAALSLVRYKERKQFPSEETVLKIIKEREEHLAQP